jgi:hypothetical protein
MSKQMVMTVAATLVVIAFISRVPAARAAVFGA